MASTVSLSIVGRPYDLTCDEGQEDYISSLAAEVERRASGLQRVVGQTSDARLLLMVALSLVDEMNEQKKQYQEHVAALENTPPPEPQVVREVVKVIDAEADAAMAAGLTAMAQHIEAIAQRLETA